MENKRGRPRVLPENMVTLNVHITAEQKDKLERFAEKKSLSISDAVRTLLERIRA